MNKKAQAHAMNILDNAPDIPSSIRESVVWLLEDYRRVTYRKPVTIRVTEGAIKLKEWIGGMLQVDAAEFFAMDTPTLCKYLHGRRIPDAKTALWIEERTGGFVSAKSWLVSCD